ncbi:MAG: hypothetical protein VKK04_12080 [Synechococcales bacterium]|nr:hypothetical protein [Synechococcales bacterium]
MELLSLFNIKRLRSAGLVGIAAGSLLAGASVIAQKAVAQTSAVNPCPSIYYEEPFDSNVLVPAGCPLNSYSRVVGETQDPSVGTGIPVQTSPQGGSVEYGAEGVAADLPPIAVVPPMDGTVDVRLVNGTNALITYEVTGETQRRYLQAQEETTLRGISLPATITTVRQDEGLVDIIPISSTDGMLELSIEEDRGLDDTQGVIRIQPDGQVFVN